MTVQSYGFAHHRCTSFCIHQVTCKGDSLITDAQVMDFNFKNCVALYRCDYKAIAAVAWAFVLEQLGAGAAELYTNWGIVLPQGICTKGGVAAAANVGE